MGHYDVIIIGTGAGGGTLARHLAPSGKRVLLLERGGWLPREPQNVSAEEVFVNGRYVSADTWRYENGEVFQPQVHYFVGGATKMYGAALYRLRAEDFGELRHHDGISPAWPIAYDEMEPYYTLAEHYYQVHGARGEDPTEPPASAPYPFPAVSHEPRIQKLSDDLAKIGHHPFHAPCGVMLDEGNMPFSACMRCDNCDGFPCIVHAKSDAEVLGVRPALEHANVELWIDSEALRLETDESGTAVTGVVVKRADGERDRHRRPRRRLLRRCQLGAAAAASANERHPNGLANGSDQVGPQLHVPQQPGGAGTVAGGEPDDLPEDARAQRLLLQRPRLRVPAGQHPDGRQVAGADVPRREARRDRARADLDAEGCRQPRGRLLALDRGSSATREPRDGGHGRDDHDRLPREQRGAEETAVRPAEVDALAPGHGSPPPAAAPRLPEERNPGCRGARTRPAPAGSARIPRRPCSTSTARPTSSTTSTSSTRASFRVSAPSIRR